MNLTKLPKKKKVTVNDLFTIDSINRLLETITKIRGSLDSVVIIFSRKNSDLIEWQSTPMEVAELVCTLESVKISLLTTPENEE